ncbi:MAG: serine protein kinase RIO [Candidatus Bilamarchaeaceae archaeon]
MAKRPSKRKLPPKDEFLLKERSKIESEVFDKKTLLILARLIKKGIIATIDFPVSTGKEADVFRATTPEGTYVAVKIYKIETAPFLRRLAYIEGDPRFKDIKKSERAFVSLFARKEFKNLEICERAHVHAPKPIFLLENVIVMEFVGKGGLPYPTMNVAGPRGEQDLNSILLDIKKMYRAGLVHADVSEYNIILAEDAPYLIDFGQGVTVEHPKAAEFLERDIRNILGYFEKFGITRSLEKTIEWIRER